MKGQEQGQEIVCLASRGNEPNLQPESGLKAAERIMRREAMERKRQLAEMRKAASADI